MREPVMAAQKINTGFSLTELLFVLVIAGILLALAIPSYRQYAQRGKRADATREMLAVAGCLERTRASTGFFDTTACTDLSENNYYLLRIAPAGEPSASEYQIIAEPIQPDSRDPCGNLSLDHTGTKGISGNPEARARCWSGR